MSVSSKLAGIGVGAALALFAFATPSAAAESADLTTGTKSQIRHWANRVKPRWLGRF